MHFNADVAISTWSFGVHVGIFLIESFTRESLNRSGCVWYLVRHTAHHRHHNRWHMDNINILLLKVFHRINWIKQPQADQKLLLNSCVFHGKLYVSYPLAVKPMAAKLSASETSRAHAWWRKPCLNTQLLGLWHVGNEYPFWPHAGATDFCPKACACVVMN